MRNEIRRFKKVYRKTDFLIYENWEQASLMVSQLLPLNLRQLFTDHKILSDCDCIDDSISFAFREFTPASFASDKPPGVDFFLNQKQNFVKKKNKCFE